MPGDIDIWELDVRVEVGAVLWDFESSSLKFSNSKVSWLAWACKLGSDISEVKPSEHGLSPLMTFGIVN